MFDTTPYEPRKSDREKAMERKNYIDYAKALCIAFVVFVHTGFSALNNILLFAMPLFFAATGYTFTIGKRSLKQNIIIRFKSIMIPFFC